MEEHWFAKVITEVEVYQQTATAQRQIKDRINPPRDQDSGSYCGDGWVQTNTYGSL